MPTKIEWTDATWSPITGCSKISTGCKHCFAERMSKRLAGRYGYPKDDPFKVTFHPNRLEQPLKWKKPRKIFVCSMSDMFHDDVDLSWIEDILTVMAEAPQHTYLILTKRPENMRESLCNDVFWPDVSRIKEGKHYLRKLWLGVTAENQEQADRRIPILLDIPAAVRFVSAEPLLENININKYLQKGLDWAIIGSESGPGRRPFNPEWAWRIIQQCKKNQKSVFYKQDQQEKTPKINGKRYIEFPQITTKQKESLFNT